MNSIKKEYLKYWEWSHVIEDCFEDEYCCLDEIVKHAQTLIIIRQLVRVQFVYFCRQVVHHLVVHIGNLQEAVPIVFPIEPRVDEKEQRLR